ncbi:glycosyltransferase family 2 protein [Paenibacillus aurantius]|uniref:Glycosyltransferase family 2 protein n=1 Tax=Paenibacillus aurantius TaxID=2918900 RepID=A0AA96LAB8_9BACL|nr:glycosyltransferase family 2 protein [Paenibacillus aurantius]WNQ10074.1 glycosyltransferase family 2 protein [Paenibacillus aurantius]
MIGSWLGYAFAALQLLVGGIGVYQILLGFAGYIRKRETYERQPEHSFAILVAAHNEEAVLGSLLDNIHKLDYPKALYEVFVICDNCTDRTARIAKAGGGKPMVREHPTLRGKGHAVEWMLQRLWEQDRSFDAVIILDADNLISPNFLTVMNNKLGRGDRVIQAYLETKNPFDSWVSVSYAIMYWFMNRNWQLARHNLGMGSVLGGTGICIESGLLKEIGWGARSLTEDVEFTARCVERGIFPTWAHDALVYDEKPIGLWSSMRQRLRWMQGHFFCARRYFWRILHAALANRSLSQLDAALYLFQPFRFLLYIIYSVMLWVQLTGGGGEGFRSLLPAWFWYGSSLLLYLQPAAVLLLERRSWKAFVGLIPYNLFLLSWIPVTVWAFFTSNNQKWSHTKHTRAIKIEEIS